MEWIKIEKKNTNTRGAARTEWNDTTAAAADLLVH
jgi:hypothetical protein